MYKTVNIQWVEKKSFIALFWWQNIYLKQRIWWITSWFSELIIKKWKKQKTKEQQQRQQQKTFILIIT